MLYRLRLLLSLLLEHGNQTTLRVIRDKEQMVIFAACLLNHSFPNFIYRLVTF